MNGNKGSQPEPMRDPASSKWFPPTPEARNPSNPFALAERGCPLAPVRSPDLLDELIAAMEHQSLTEFERYFRCSTSREIPEQCELTFPKLYPRV